MNEIVKKIKNSHLPFLYTTDIYYDKETDKIIILMVDEAVTTDISNQYEKYFDSIGLTMDKVLIFHSNANINRKGYYFLDNFFMECKRLLNRHPDYGKIDYNIKKEKIYSCLNHSENKHRTIIFNGLKSRKLLKYGFVSYLDKGVYLPRNIEDSRTEKYDWRWPTLIPEVVSKTYFNVVTETHHNIEKDFDDLFITEKICKALITEPFIIVGNCGSLNYVKEKGFETYPELFDESYDLIENPKDRLEFILDEIERLCNMDKNELEKIYKSVVWKIEHNRKIMVDFEEDEFVSKIGGDEINYAV